MARICFCLLIVAIFIVEIAISVDPPIVTPSPAPELDPPGTGAPESSSPSDSPFFSPPAPSPDLGVSPGSSPAPNPISSVPVPAPSESEVSHSNVSADVNDAASGGMSGGKKAGIAFGMIAAVGLVAGAGCLLKKRRDNERRAQYGFAARREIL